MKITTLALSLSIIIAPVTIGCSGDASRTTAESSSPADQVYTVRGIIKSLPTEGERGSELRIHHEAIPNFVQRSGKVTGMSEMTMPFYLAEKELIKDLAVGDEVSFTLEVRWQEKPFDKITRIEKLPAGSVMLSRK
jgi:Cu/Ag efflux protein CusF